MTCTRHPHSSERTALKCWQEGLGKRADRILRQVVRTPALYAQVKCSPPKVVQVGLVQVVYFFRGERVGWRV